MNAVYHIELKTDFSNLLIVNKYKYFCSEAWDKEKYWVPDVDQTHRLPDTSWAL